MYYSSCHDTEVRQSSISLFLISQHMNITLLLVTSVDLVQI
jgi:hypothetical protein